MFKIFLFSVFYSLLLSSFSFAYPWGGESIGYNPSGGGFLTGTQPASYFPGTRSQATAFPQIQTQSPFGFPSSSQQVVSSSLITQQAKIVIGRWRQKVVANQDNPQNITDTKKNINADRRTLERALNIPGLTPDQANTIAQIQILLNLAEIRFLTNDSKNVASRFALSYRSILSDSNESDKNTSYYIEKRDQLSALLQGFQQFLTKNPAYYQNPPELLVGLRQSLEAGQKTLEEYKQFTSCLTSPDIPYCADLSQKNDTSVRNPQNLDPNGQYDYDYDYDYDE